MNKNHLVYTIVFLILMQGILADGLSVQLKRTNPGIAGTKSAEMIFDIVNTDFNTQIEGFLFCRSPDDVMISSTLGVGSGSGAQYVSPKFEMNEGPSQKSMSLVFDSNVEGDMTSGCILKYIPFSEIRTETSIFDNVTNTTIINVEKNRSYYRMNGVVIKKALDNDYRELRLDKTIPFAPKMTGKDVSCPEGQTTCKADELNVTISKNWFVYGFMGLLILIIAMSIYALGKR